MKIAFDASASSRRFDDNGFLHVALSPISKECVNPYYGREIPGWQEHKLDPEKIYYGYRQGASLEAAADTFNGLNVLDEHVIDGACHDVKEHLVGSMGTDAVFESPYLKNSLIIKNADAIKRIESGEQREISASYYYDPDFSVGVFDGERYDFIMKNIRGNHVALVEKGRAGRDVLVSDELPKPFEDIQMEDVKKEVVEIKEESSPAAEEKEEVSSDFDMLSELKRLAEKAEGPVAEKLSEIVGILEQGDETTVEEKEEEPKAFDMEEEVARRVSEELSKRDAASSEKVSAASDCRTIIGDCNPLSFDSAGDIYRKALAASGHVTEVSDIVALKEMISLAVRGKASAYPVMDEALVKNDKQVSNVFKSIRIS